MKPRFASVSPSGFLPFLFLAATLAAPAAADEPTVFELRELARTKSAAAIVNGGKSPYSYAWSYSGTANSWSGGGAYYYAYYNFSPYCTSSSFNLFQVTVTDANGQTAFGSISPLSCY